MENQNNIISGQGNQAKANSQLDADLAIDNQNKSRNDQREKKYDLILEQKSSLKNVKNGNQNSNDVVTQDGFATATLDDNNDVIDYEDKEDDDLA